MLDLALETSSSHGSLALGNESVVVQAIEFKSGQRPSQALFPALVRIGLPRLKLRRIIVGLGPGSFSGIRVALAAAQGIALAQGVPVIGICSAYSVSMQLPQVTKLGVFADAKRHEIFCTSFTRGQLDRSTYLISIDHLEEHVSRFTRAISAEPLKGVPEQLYPRAQDLLSIPQDCSGWITEGPLEPIYLRGAVAGVS